MTPTPHTLKLIRGAATDAVDLAGVIDSGADYGLIDFRYDAAVRNNSVVSFAPQQDSGYVATSAQPLSTLTFEIEVQGSSVDDLAANLQKINKILSDAIVFQERKYGKIGDRQNVLVEYKPSGATSSVYWLVLGVAEWPVVLRAADTLTAQKRTEVRFRLIASPFPFGEEVTAIASVAKNNNMNKLNASSTIIEKGDVGALWNIMVEGAKWEMMWIVEGTESYFWNCTGSVDANAIGGTAFTTTVTSLTPTAVSTILDTAVTRACALRAMARVRIQTGTATDAQFRWAAAVKNTINGEIMPKRYGEWVSFPYAYTGNPYWIIDLGEIKIDDLFWCHAGTMPDPTFNFSLEVRSSGGSVTLWVDAIDVIQYRSSVRIKSNEPTKPDGAASRMRYLDYAYMPNETTPIPIIQPAPLIYDEMSQGGTVVRLSACERAGRLLPAPTFRGTTLWVYINNDTAGHVLGGTFFLEVKCLPLYASGLRGNS